VLNIEIAVFAKEPEAAPRLVRRSADASGKVEGRLVVVELGPFERARVRLRAVEATKQRPITASEWRALVEGADAVICAGPDLGAAELDGLFGAEVPVFDTEEADFALAVERAVQTVIERREQPAPAAPGRDAYTTFALTCPWCFEPVDLGVEADVQGSFVQDCEVCCHPWTVTVTEDEDGDRIVRLDRP
jgi:hypothetical protein